VKKVMKNTVKLNICGINYFINTDESAEYTENLGKRIDERMSQILKKGSLITMTQAAVLVALEMADELSKSEANVDNFSSQIKDYLEDSAKAKSERDYYKRELERYKTEAKFKNDQINLFAGVRNENEE
jgi:cell division protein ZapA